MAQRVTVELRDDLEGGPAVETVRFGLGGAEYEIDLSEKNARTLRQQLPPISTMPAKPGQAHGAGRRAPRRACCWPAWWDRGVATGKGTTFGHK